ncbi:MAG: elongation factor Ts [Parcubacteria group bacterium]
MSNIDIVKELREITGLSFKEISKAVEEAGGDKCKALEVLKKTGADIAGKKAQRSTEQGLVDAYIHGNGRLGVLTQMLCETDFVAKNPLFSELAHEISMHIAAMDPENVEELLKQEYVRDSEITINDLITQYIAKIGENIKVGKFVRLTM